MDSIPRKRKLSEFGTNVTSPRGQTFCKTPVTTEENLYGLCHKCQRICETSNYMKSQDKILPNGNGISCQSAGQMPEYWLVGCRGRQFWVLMRRTNTSWPLILFLLKASSNCLDVQKEPREKLKTITEAYKNESEQFYPGEEEEISQEYDVYNVEKIKQTELDNNEGTDNLWYNTDYIEDIIYHEMHKESLYQLSGNFCRKYDINPIGREILIDWLISVQVSVRAENSVLHLAVALLDILLDSLHVPLSGMQAAAIAAFWVAYKFTHGSISMKTLLSFCAGTVTKTMIRENEILVLQTSRLIETGGSLTVFFNYLLYNIFGVKFPSEIYYCGLYFIEIMLLQFMFVDCAAYEKAVTAVFTALCVFGAVSQFDFVDVSRFITKRRLQQVYRRLMRSLKLMYYDKSALKNSSVYIKYKSSRYCKISIHQNLKCLATA